MKKEMKKFIFVIVILLATLLVVLAVEKNLTGGISILSRTGNLDIGSTPNGASTYLDGRYKGVSPLVIKRVSLGNHEVLLRKLGYNEYRTTVTIIARQTTFVRATLIQEQTCPICPPPTAWSDCVNSVQTRTNYKCDASTNYQCQAYTETQACTTCSYECNRCSVNRNKCHAYFKSTRADCGDACTSITYVYDATCDCTSLPSCIEQPCSAVQEPFKQHFLSTVGSASLNLFAPPTTETEWQFEKEHLDDAIGSDHFYGLKSRGATAYLRYYTLLNTPESKLDTTAGQQEISDMKTFCENRALNFEDAFLHYSDDTTITKTSDSRYPSSTALFIRGWPSGTASTREESRVIHDIGYGRYYVLYHKSPCSQQYKAYRNKLHLTTAQNGYYWDGLFVDEYSGRADDALNIQASGGHIAEYGGKTYNQITTYAQDQASMLNAVKQEIGSALMFPNVAEYVDDNAKTVALAADGGDSELLSGEGQKHTYGEVKLWDFAKSITSPGKYYIWSQRTADFDSSVPYASTYTASNYRSIEERHDMFSLSSYFMAKDKNLTLYAQKAKGWSVPLSLFWMKAREYNIGQPLVDYYLWKDSTTLGNKDSAGQNYKIYRRDYDNAIILFRTYIGWSDNTNLGAQTLKFSLGGIYKILYPDGTLSSGITEISLALSEGVVLVRV